MNKVECKKYLKRAYKQVIAHNKSITPRNIEDEMKSVIDEQRLEYIAFAKIAADNMQNCANEDITLRDLINEIDVLPRIYTTLSAIQKAENL